MTKLLCKEKTTAENIILQTSNYQQIPIHISENFDIKHLRWSKIDLSKKTKKDSKKRSTNFRSSRLEMFCQKEKKKKKLIGKEHR